MLTVEDIELYDQIQNINTLIFKNIHPEKCKRRFLEVINQLNKINDQYMYIYYKNDKLEIQGNTYINYLYMRVKKAKVDQELLKKSIN